MKANIGEKEADDFLRIFWMGNYGLIQRPRLYSSLKKKFNNPALTYHLMEKLFAGSEIYAAIEEPKHQLWQGYSSYTRHLIDVLVLLKSKQTRPIIFACVNVSNVKSELMESVLWILVVLTIRFQTIGKRRQGILEKQCAKIAQEISAKGEIELSHIQSEVQKILPDDEEFLNDFVRYEELNMKRALYFLASLELFNHSLTKSYKDIWEEVEYIIDSKSGISISHIIPKKLLGHLISDQNEEETLALTTNLSNLILTSIDDERAKPNAFEQIKFSFEKSRFWTTSDFSSMDFSNIFSFQKRQKVLGQVAVNLWTISTSHD
jgi:hypothetical protein